jgi:hypothetical protein
MSRNSSVTLARQARDAPTETTTCKSLFTLSLMQVRPMRNRLAFLRFAYWFGAIADGATIVPLLVPSVAAAMLGIDAFHPGPDYRYATTVGAALMAGWTTLLVWRALRPVDRRDVLLLTVLPVMVGLVAAGAYAVSTGFVSLPHMAPTFVFQVVGIAIFLTAYAIAPPCASSQSSQS